MSREYVLPLSKSFLCMRTRCIQSVSSVLGSELIIYLAVNTIKFHGTINVGWMKVTVRRQMALYMGCISVRRRLEIRYFASDVERFEIVIQELERGSLLGAGVPTLQHQSVDAVGQRMIQWFRHAVAFVYLLDHFAAMHAWKEKIVY